MTKQEALDRTACMHASEVFRELIEHADFWDPEIPEVPKLLPCPFCESDDVDILMNSSGGHYCECLSCGARTIDSITKVRVVEYWNRRPDLA